MHLCCKYLEADLHVYNVSSKYTSRAFVFAVPLHACTELEMCFMEHKLCVCCVLYYVAQAKGYT